MREILEFSLQFENYLLIIKSWSYENKPKVSGNVLIEEITLFLIRNKFLILEHLIEIRVVFHFVV
jgi:hypothetical protein